MTTYRNTSYTMMRENKNYDAVSCKLCLEDDSPVTFQLFKGDNKEDMTQRFCLGAASTESLMAEVESWQAGNPRDISQVEFDRVNDTGRVRFAPAMSDGMGIKIQYRPKNKWKNIVILTEDQSTRLIQWFQRNS